MRILSNTVFNNNIFQHKDIHGAKNVKKVVGPTFTAPKWGITQTF